MRRKCCISFFGSNIFPVLVFNSESCYTEIVASYYGSSHLSSLCLKDLNTGYLIIYVEALDNCYWMQITHLGGNMCVFVF